MEKIWVETHASPILIEDELIGIQLIIRDISERKYEEEIPG